MSAGEFGGREFSIETVKGARSFDVDKYGRLRGVSFAQVWRPGENVAECRAYHLERDALRLQQLINDSVMRSYQGIGVVVPERHVSDEIKPENPRPHDIADCKCGFYAYFDGSDDHCREDRVSAIVEGYGEVVLGTRGFRATKARILALCVDLDRFADVEDCYRRSADRARRAIARNYPRIPLFASFDQMVAEFPTDTGHVLTPENTEDFWTRDAS